MTRLAVLVGGEFRTFKHCFQSWKFLNNVDNYDIFLSTWSTTHQYSDNYTAFDESFTKEDNPNYIEQVDEDTVLNILGKPPKFLNIESEINFDHRGNKQIYHWQRTLISLMNYRQNYDFVILIRPDVNIIDNNDNFIKLINDVENKLYGVSEIKLTPPPLPFVVTVNEILFAGPTQKIIDTFLPVPYMKIKSNEELILRRGDCFHTHLAQYFINNDIYVYSLENKHISTNVVRKV